MLVLILKLRAFLNKIFELYYFMPAMHNKNNFVVDLMEPI